MLRTAGLFACLAGCYAPTPEPGSPCSGGRPCPAGLECSPATQTCEHEAVATDARPPVDASLCYGTGLVRLCLSAAPTDTTLLGSIDTDTSAQCLPYDGSGLCVVAAAMLAVTSSARATGQRPLVLVGENIAISGALDVASRRTASAVQLGAGAGAPCLGGGAPAQKGGGPGGTLGTIGGAGGIGSAGSAAAAPVMPVTMLRGGCPGGSGVGTTPGVGGAGGGAVYLIARSAITITGDLNASGAGGEGAASEGGGGGGGSGGMIGLDAPHVIVAGSVFANGGGGGEGGGGASGTDGANPTMATTPAPGGAGGAPNGGDGGAGAAGATSARSGGNNTGTAGGGGGGGGAGVIRVFPPQPLGGIVSPPPS